MPATRKSTCVGGTPWNTCISVTAPFGSFSVARTNRCKAIWSTPNSGLGYSPECPSGRMRDRNSDHCEVDERESADVNMRISKSKFMAGRQCLKRLYFQVHQPELAAEPSAASEAVIKQGREVGMLARQLFPGGVEVRSEGL